MKRSQRPRSTRPPEHAKTAAKPARVFTGPLSRKRLWCFRLAALLLGPALFFLLVELALRLAGFGHPTSFLLPARIKDQDELVQNDRFAWTFFGPEMARRPFPLSIPKSKAADTIRIFVFGESAAYGDPQPEFGLPRMLETLLQARYPNSRFEVFNAAMTAINSHAIREIAQDCARQNGDIWVVYMGNNEVVGPYGAGTVFGPKSPNLALIRATLAIKRTRFGQGLDRLLASLDRRPASQKEWGGMQMFVKQQVRGDAPQMPAVYSNFHDNLSDILETGRRHRVGIVLSTVASNLRDCAPFASMHRPNLSPDELTRWEKLYADGVIAQTNGLLPQALQRFREAEEIDASFAELHYRSGQCLLALDQDAEAQQQMALARDEDTLRFRCDSKLNEIISRTASGRERERILLADSREAIAKSSPHGIVGREYFYEHVHLTWEGNYLLGLTIAQQVARLLPESVTRPDQAIQSWPSIEECARRLAWTDWNRCQADTQMLGRLGDAPFTMQLDIAGQCRRLRMEIEALLPSVQPPGLRSAESCYRQALARAPEDWLLHRNLARLLETSHDFQGAVEHWRTVTDLQPNQAEAWEGLAGALAQSNREDEAVSAFQQALRLEPDSATAGTGCAQLLLHQGKISEAVRLFERVLARKPYWGPAHLGLGSALEALGKDSEAQAHFRQALQNRMNTPASFKALAQFCFEKKWFNEAATNFTDALRLNPADAATHVNLGLTFSLLGRHTEARNQFAEAVRLDPNLAEARVRFGTALGSEGKDAEAMEQFAAAVELKPEMLEARLNLAVALFNQHRNSEALAQFQEVLRRNPTNPTALNYVRSLAGDARKATKL